MLDKSSLSQLKELKQQIHEATERSTGTVKGTSKRFGFVVDDKDGQQYLLPQATMDLLLPGDRIKFALEPGKNEDQKPVARVEKLLESPFDQFVGQVKAKNNQLFVIPDHPQLRRWIFIPPKFRKNLKEGYLVHARVCQHPFKNKGRVQAGIIDVLGEPDDPFIEHRYAIAKENIAEKIWQPDDLEAIRQTSERLFEEALAEKTDCRDQLFFTIDGPNTQDLDDALSISELDDGWRLSIAIADAASFVTPGSPLDKVAARQAQTIYLPGQKVSMLPDILAADLCSLRPEQDRLALICHLNIGHDGTIRAIDYSDAVIHSKAKLNFDEVSALLENGEGELPDTIKTALQTLKNLFDARRQWRKKHALLMDENPDYRLYLDDKGKINRIERSERNIAQAIIEECMLTCNEATARFMQENLPNGLYLAHKGFKQDQLPGIEKMLNSYFPEQSVEALSALDSYRDFFSTLDDSPLPFKDILRKKMQRSLWAGEPAPHFGLGLGAYTTFTSPMRKYTDLLVHRLIKSWLKNGKAEAVPQATIDAINEALLAVRRVQRDCELSLKCQYLKDFKGQEFDGEISMINHRVIGVYLPQFDVHGQLDVHSLDEPVTFRQDTLQLLSENRQLQLKQHVRVSIDSIDLPQRRIGLKLVESNEQQ